jgi:hypothetical protein
MLQRAQEEWKNSLLEKEESLVAVEDINISPPKAEFLLADPIKEMLPVDPGTFDVVISCLGLHWVNDVPVRRIKFTFFPLLFARSTTFFFNVSFFY